MFRFILRYYDIRSGEGRRICMMSVYIFLIITTIIIIKSIATSFFLSNVGIEKLPAAFILVAVFSVIAVSIYNNLGRSRSLSGKIIGTLVFSITSLLIFRFLLFVSPLQSWLYYLLYVWSALFGVTVVAQFWLLANTIFNAREAKRFFGLLGTGAIAGGICGGYITNFLAPIMHSGNLLVFASGILTVCIFIVGTIVKKTTHIGYKAKTIVHGRIKSTVKKKNPLKIISESGLLTSAMLLIFFSVLSASFVDYQFNALASESIADANELTAFIGFWLSTLSLVSLAIQLFFTQIIIKTFGVCTSLAMLPIGLFVGALGMLISPTLAVATAMKLTGGSLRNSIHKSSLELFVVPVPSDEKNKTKAFIDIVTDNVATGLSGIILMLLMQYSGFTVRSISYAVVIMAGMQIFILLRARIHYIRGFKKAIERRNIDFDRDVTPVHDPHLKKMLLHNIDNYNERQLLFVLQLLSSVENPELFDKVMEFTRHANPGIRCRAIYLLGTNRVNDASRCIRPLMFDPVRDVQIEALQYLTRDPEKRNDLVEYMNYSDSTVVGAALLCTARVLVQDAECTALKNSFIRNIERLVEQSSTETLEAVARSISESGVSQLYPHILALLDHQAVTVRKEAIVAAGKCRYKPALSHIIAALKNRDLRYTARTALIAYGPSVLQISTGIIEDETADRDVRRELIKVSGEIDSQESVDFLMNLLNSEKHTFKSEIIHALQSLCKKFPQLIFSLSKSEIYIKKEIGNYRIMRRAQDMQCYQLSRSPVDGEVTIEEARGLMIRTLKEKRLKTVKGIFGILGLRFGSQDMGDAFQGLRSSNGKTSAHSIEFLDSVLHRNMKSYIIPLAEEVVRENSEKQRSVPLKNFQNDEFETLKPLLEGADRWLQTCTLYLLGTLRMNTYIECIRKYTMDSDAVTRETAEAALAGNALLSERRHPQC